MARDANDWIEVLDLVPHPEGGHYRETYRARGSVPGAGEHPAGRSFSTAIYYLLRSGEVSRLHRLRSDEVFHHYAGAALTLHVLDPGGEYRRIEVGDDPGRGETPQALVGAGAWFGSTVETPDTFALVGCTVAPGFELGDFELAPRGRLVELFPRHRELIERLT